MSKKNNDFPKKNNLSVKKKFFLYKKIKKNFLKQLLLKLFTSKIFSKIIGFYFRSFISKIHIKKVLKKNNIDLNLFTKNKFKSYNDFFTRKYKKIIFPQKKKIFISPGEGLISIYPILQKSIYSIKNVQYHISDLLKNNQLSKEYINGYIVILRLRPTDYHRYIFIDNGIQSEPSYKIKGRLHTVQPIAFKYFNVFKENSREYSILETENFGKIIQVEVGALLVGKINNFFIPKFYKGQEKGFFSLGGSTIILLIKEKKVSFETYILKNTKENLETQIKLGEKIGTKFNFHN
jgi:phosphatidylserine decarboxylase